MRRLAKQEKIRRGTGAVCPGGWKEIGADDDADGRGWLTKHLVDCSANEYLNEGEDPERLRDLTKLFWKQNRAIEKEKARERAREEGRCTRLRTPMGGAGGGL